MSTSGRSADSMATGTDPAASSAVPVAAESEIPGEVPGPARRRRGRKPSVTLDQISAAALDVGFTCMTMSAVAEHLGVNHATLYRYVDGKSDLVLRAVDRALVDAPVDLAISGWRELLRETALVIWRTLAKYPGIATELSAGAMPKSMFERANLIMERLMGMGFTSQSAITAVEMVFDAVIGNRRNIEQVEGSIPGSTMPDRRSLEELWEPAGSTGVVGHAIRTAAHDALYDDPAERFRQKLEIILSGIAAELAPPT
ncbi:TetR/AcrR family transcriptional regulator [Rhodococcus sp. D2-41]|uniref:TetR/AcrR family transcriptional regulator n=1 Tax=Speluncibacter jeojiensis TaxID=2710754 RepID=A0A9X4M3I9_9ACTN|nr:TetR/AcrR family transcriptional regulator [Rhodococcus sp. D2-41]MDG3009817.1 TetR/AcrR family transcriptional regulator [Rhodococcus sp. D2-41]MDG3014568.1 TetR/AcrR family transcriptional regulator [Corynebacteriales bacterium D3-21]